MRFRAIVPVLAVMAAAACSSAEEAGAPPVKIEEQRALAEAEAMIPPGELPADTATAAAEERDADDQ